LAIVTVPVALYAALATPTFGVPLALTAAVAGVAVVVYWIYLLLSELSKIVQREAAAWRAEWARSSGLRQHPSPQTT